MNDFEQRNERHIRALGADEESQRLTRQWFDRVSTFEYSYHFTWLGRPIIQFPQDVVAAQEIIWATKPDLIIETGIAHGGSLIFYASLLELLGGDGLVLGIDVDIRAHNRAEIEKHQMSKRIRMIQGSSTDPDVVAQVRKQAMGRKSVMVVLDSNHTRDHVAAELDAYADLVTKGNYLLVFDTVIEDMSPGAFPNRPWGKGDNPKIAVHRFLERDRRFEIDRRIQDKLLITVAPDGYLRRVAD